MKRKTIVSSCIALALAVAITASPFTNTAYAAEETLVGQGDGFGGPVTVTLTMDGDKITDVEIEGAKETKGIGTPAIEQLPEKIIEANGADVDVVATATVTSNAIIYAVNNALDPEAYPYPIPVEEKAPAEAVEAASVYQGFGLSNSGRIGPGTDNEDVQIYSINNIFAHVLFDEDGKILAMQVDQIETATPNYDGENMPHFSGFPGQGGYNADTDHDEVVESVVENKNEGFQDEIASWQSKRERGDAYRMNSGTWYSEMDAFQELFVGMTVEEIEEWYNAYCSDVNGRPLKDGSTNEKDAEKYDALSDDDKEMLADLTASATMSLNDSHGNILEAIVNAFENKVPLDIEGAAAIGVGNTNVGRIGPGTDDNGVQIYSVNQVYVNSLFDEDGRIVAIYADEIEYISGNAAGGSTPVFSGFPGQIPFGEELTDELFLEEIASWTTKRERGDSYRMNSGTWVTEMDAFQELFIGMTVEEVVEWYEKYCSDVNGRPLKDGSTNESDIAKYDALSDDDKAMLADLTASATMSLNDPHGDILSAIVKSYTNAVQIDLKVK